MVKVPSTHMPGLFFLKKLTNNENANHNPILRQKPQLIRKKLVCQLPSVASEIRLEPDERWSKGQRTHPFQLLLNRPPYIAGSGKSGKTQDALRIS